MSENELQKSDSEVELLPPEDEKLRQMLNGLKKVNAPKNFDFHLKARIAKTKPQDYQTASLIPFLRYLLPFSVVILLAFFVGFNLLITTQNTNDSQAKDSKPVETDQIEITSASNLPVNAVAAANYPQQTGNLTVFAEKELAPTIIEKKAAENNLQLATLTNKKDPQQKSKIKAEDSFNLESALSAPKVLTPRGIPPQGFEDPAQIRVRSSNIAKQIFDFIGISAVFEAERWKVTSVSRNNMADRAGIKVGDFIEAIDNNKLDSDIQNTKIVSVKVLHVIRDGKRISLELNK